ncbi:MAG: 3-deoxy-manno-octulosonate cytidylyltransferase [Oligoflexia bacterium]|nr:3-deoxy-manno-octulosonate cytidylyltransferase [Oligoflexia bacterium]
MKAIGVIPARFGSTRFEGKPLKPILGKPMIQWVVEGALQSKMLDKVVVATDDRRIAQVVESLGVDCAMTDSAIKTGTDRVWKAVQERPEYEVVLNIQGDEPLITGSILDSLVDLMTSGSEMATLAREFQKPSEIESRTTAKIILNQNNEATYFSRLPIPYSRESLAQGDFACVKHIGLYAFRRAFLERFCAQAPVSSEVFEGLEQLRALWLGARIKVGLVNFDSWGVDTPEDVIRVEEILKSRGGRGHGQIS